VPSAVASGREWNSLEVTIGAKWFNWVGVILVIVGVMFFLGYAYDNNWIGPAGRIAIAALGGAAALVSGERFRRASYPILFQALTGGGLAVFYGCIYFSFQVYGLAGQPVAFALSVVVTALAVAIAVVHNAPGICLLGQLGGFLSPVLLSTGANRPFELFSFVSVLNFATIGCAWRRNWRLVNAAGFIGTWLLYTGWAARFYDSSQIGPALFFSALFYVMFLLAAMLPAISRRLPLVVQDLFFLSVVIFVEFVNNYGLLHVSYRAWLGAAVVAQALTVAALYVHWTHRLKEDSRARSTLLLFALALVTVAVPIQLRFYGVPIGWALEALMLGYVGQRYRSWPFQLGSFIAAMLSAMSLLASLPLHTEFFTPVFNRPFGSWATVIAMTFALSAVLDKNRDRLEASLRQAVPAVGLIALVLACLLAHLEISAYWNVRTEEFGPLTARSHEITSLTLLWSAIPLLLLRLGRSGVLKLSVPVACAAYLMSVTMFLRNVADGSWIVPDVPFVNLEWLSRLCVALSLWIGVSWMRSVRPRPQKAEAWTALLHTLETAGHVVLAILLFTEVNSWISSSRIFSPLQRFGFVSALWSLQALLLIGLGLATRSQFRRILGFILFGATVGKLLLVDMAVLQPVYRVLSFAATGALLIVAAYLYQRFFRSLLDTRVPPKTRFPNPQ
jgi:uncharacterized membrane protein